MKELAISFDDILAADQRLAGVAHRTPILTSTTANEMAGAQLYFKCENFQRMGAFKFRGAYNAIAQFTPEQRSGGVIAYSSGNHAQAIALSARLLEVNAVVIMPSDAPRSKLAAARSYGGEIVLYDRLTEDREEMGRQISEARGLTLIPPYDHPHVMAGQGTVAKELLEDVGELDILITPLGGGGLLSGCAIATKAMNPHCMIIGVEPEAGNDGQRSLQSGRIVHIDPPDTIADGARTQHLGQYTFPVLHKLVDTIVTVSDAQLIDAMKFLAGRMKILLEPTGCLAAAAIFGKKIDARGKRVGIVLSGGNIDLAGFAALVEDNTSLCQYEQKAAPIADVLPLSSLSS